MGDAKRLSSRYAYITREGHPLWGNNPKEIIESLHEASWFPGSALDIFMKKTAVRAHIQTGKPIRGARAYKLFGDLLTAGLIRKEKTN